MRHSILRVRVNCIYILYLYYNYFRVCEYAVCSGRVLDMQCAKGFKQLHAPHNQMYMCSIVSPQYQYNLTIQSNNNQSNKRKKNNKIAVHFNCNELNVSLHAPPMVWRLVFYFFIFRCIQSRLYLTGMCVYLYCILWPVHCQVKWRGKNKNEKFIC